MEDNSVAMAPFVLKVRCSFPGCVGRGVEVGNCVVTGVLSCFESAQLRL